MTESARLTGSGKALVVTLFFRLLFGGYLAGMDQYRYNDIESALSVILIYGLFGIFAALFLLGKRYGLVGLMGLSVLHIIAQSAYVIWFLGLTTIDASIHNPVENWWAVLLIYLFAVLTIIFSFRVYRET